MTSPILIDANIAIYAMGREHALRQPSLRVLDLAADYPSRFFTDAEVLQELLHRSIALKRWKDSRRYFMGFLTLMDGRIEPMLTEDVETAAKLADDYDGLSARDLIHAAVMLRAGSRYIVTADGGFDSVNGIERLDPMLVDEWATTVTANPR
jgi:predicted nucleic acid-binding protein